MNFTLNTDLASDNCASVPGLVNTAVSARSRPVLAAGQLFQQFPDRRRRSTRLTRRGLRVITGLVCLLLQSPKAAPAQAICQYERLHSFGYPQQAGARPYANLIEGLDGELYGTARDGGLGGKGVVFKLNKDGSGYTVLKSFTGSGGDGAIPYCGLVQSGDGLLYGTTFSGGTNNNGTVFRLNPDGTGYAVLKSFNGSDGTQPRAGLIQGNDGALYGTTSGGGTNGYGTAFRLNTDGTGYAVLKSFSGLGGDGAVPLAPLMQSSDGVLYGTTQWGGTNDRGSVFKLNADGTGFVVLWSFAGGAGDGEQPVAGLLMATNGTLYGTTQFGGSSADLGSGRGTVFKLNPDGTGYGILRSFIGIIPSTPYQNGVYDGAQPCAGLVQGTDGALYGTTAGGGGTVFRINTDGTGYAVLEDYNAPPYGALVQATNGVLYGTAASTWDNQGSIWNNNGGVFKVNPDGSGYGLLWSFLPAGGDGSSPSAGLIQGKDGTLYGTTPVGGGIGYGSIFRLGTNGTAYTNLITDLRPWSSTPPAGHYGPGLLPLGGVVQGNDEVLYGTLLNPGSGVYGSSAVGFKLNTDGTGYLQLPSALGGAEVTSRATPIQGSDGALYGTVLYATVSSYNYYVPDCGSVWRMNTDGSGFTNLWTFTSGCGPNAALLQASDGALYGTTEWGGATSNSFGSGTVFKLNTDGSSFTVLKAFTGAGGDGADPQSALVQGTDGALYGTTHSGGSNGLGTVFKLNTNGTGYAVIKSFTGTGGDGAQPAAGLVQGTDGALYGTTYSGGSYGFGTIFKLSTDGSGYAVLKSFSNTNGDGAYPMASLVQGTDGGFYGTTQAGGDMGFGTVFRLALVNTNPVPVLSARILPPNESGAVAGQALAAGESQFVLSWNAVIGRYYQVQYKTSLAQTNWGTLASLAATNSTTMLSDALVPNSQRYYRVVLLP